MTLGRGTLLSAYWTAVAACDPATRVRAALANLDGRCRFGVAIGKAALAMARGAGPVERGVIIVPRGEPIGTPAGWRLVESAHPFVDERSLMAARAARAVIDAAGEGDLVLALISGGTSALIEEPIDGLTLAELDAATRAVMQAGAPIGELNAARSALSRVKRGGLVATCAAPVITLAVSDVIGDDLTTIGSGPTIRSRDGDRAIVIACGMNPHYGDFDTYHMAASAIDEAVRNCVAVGADPAKIAILDNFCWGDCEKPETLGSLVRAALACHDMSVALGTPFISGKDSLNNEFSYIGPDGEKQTIAIPPSLLISAMGQMDDCRRAVTMDVKTPGNLIYLVGETKNELGGSHYALVNNLDGGAVPKVDGLRAKGYTLVTVPELLGTITPGKKYFRR